MLQWNDGIIAKLESFAMSRMPIDIKFARGGAICLVSTALNKAVLMDKLGPVRPNVFIFHVDASGSYKTPYLNRIKEIVKQFNINYKGPTTLTQQGMTAWIAGTPPVATEAHPVNFIIKDEASKWVSDLQQRERSGLIEYMSQLWDDEIEGYVTRTYGNEGNLQPYTVIFAATTGTFFDHLEKSFFQQGFGNRPLWSVGDFDKSKIRLAESDFFFGLGKEDEEWESLSDDIIEKLNCLEKIRQVLVGDSNHEWKKWRYDLEVRAAEVKGGEGEYLRKQPLNALKLAMIYAASRMSISPEHDDILFVLNEDIHRAIQDVEGYIKGWKDAMKVWSAQAETKNESVEVASDLMKRVIEVAANSGGVMCLRTISAALDIANYDKLARGITLGVNKEYIEAVNSGTGEIGTATIEELKRVHTKGPIPQMWRLTEAGRKFLEG